MKLENITHSNNKQDSDFLALLEYLEKGEPSEEGVDAINIARAMISEKSELIKQTAVLIDEKEELKKERQRLIEENNALKEQLKILVINNK